MRRLLRRWLGVERPSPPPAPPSEPPSITRKQFADLEERVDILEGQFNRWRGRQTGGLAHSPKPKEDTEPRQDAPEPTNGGEPMVEPAFDRHMALASHRRARNGVLPR